MKKHLGKILAGVSILLAVLALIMVFVGYGAAPGDKAIMGSKSVKLLKLVFGNKDQGFAASAGLIIAFILVIGGIACTVVSLLGKGGKIVPIVGAVLLVVGGVLYFCTVQFVTFDIPDGTPDALADMIKDAFKESYKLGAGSILAGVLSILSGILCASTILVKKD